MSFKRFLFLCVLTFQSIHSQNKYDNAELKIDYQMTISNDQGNNNGADVRHSYDFTLLCNAVKSIYANNELPNYYEFIRKSRSNRQAPSLDRSMYPKSKSSVYKDGESVVVTLPVGNNLYSFNEPELKWETVSSEKKEILGNLCSKAKAVTDTGKLYYAWYCPKIPVPEGPFRFKGLVGLILEVHNEDRSLIIEATKIEKSNSIIEPIAYINTVHLKEKADFIKKRSEYIDNPNADKFSSPYKAYTLDGKEIKADKRKSLKLNENILLD
ncbi:GLPGLI family protein [Chryseobacterium caseinilyticum]|uniref:GLPGLI family protein n=1 Tax=Chryseobacterium caseinilyticum TaxID=2771428 RepID=A0ABR8Z8T0_9FLAO|nr:GLPGLI family protein [Chryseobacterium caseinilyticum]MBD8081667.1 GLPGLI family protein [Chryseobacterium caseinilyticum]